MPKVALEDKSDESKTASDIDSKVNAESMKVVEPKVCEETKTDADHSKMHLEEKKVSEEYTVDIVVESSLSEKKPEKTTSEEATVAPDFMDTSAQEGLCECFLSDNPLFYL